MKTRILSQKGFTLVEILFVLLIIALIVGMALPGFRAVRYDIKNSRAKGALKKLAEARRTFYQNTKGWNIQNDATFTGADAKTYASQTCNNPSSTGVPASTYSKISVSPAQLFACGFLDWKDFAALPYTFYICDRDHGAETGPCNTTGLIVGAIGISKAEAGAKYQYEASNCKYWMHVPEDTMRVRDSEDIIEGGGDPCF